MSRPWDKVAMINSIFKRKLYWALASFLLLSIPTLYYGWNHLSQSNKNFQRKEARNETLSNLLRTLRTTIDQELIQIQILAQSGEMPTNKSWAYWAKLGLGTKRIQTLKKSKKNPNVPEIKAKFFENFFLTALQKKILTRELIEKKKLFFLIPKYVGTSRKSRHDWHVFVFLDETDPTFRSANVLALSPYWSMKTYQKNEAILKNGLIRAYLMHNTGKVLGHSQASYIGAKINNPKELKATSETESITTLTLKSSIDQMPVMASIFRWNQWPLTMVVESLDPTKYNNAGVLTRAKNHSGITGLLLIVFGLLTVILFFSFQKKFRLNTFKPSQSPDSPSGTEATGIPVSIVNNQMIIGAVQKDLTLPKITQSKFNIPRQDDEAIRLVSQFELASQRFRDSRIIASSLTQTISQLCESPVLFFRFNSKINLAFLETDAGLKSKDSIDEFSFPLHKGAIQRIFDCTKRGKLASLAQYEPLSKPIMEQLGIACFEAWAIPRMNLKQEIELLGIVVILHSGVLSSTRRDLLVRMMRSMAIYHPAQPSIKSQESSPTK